MVVVVVLNNGFPRTLLHLQQIAWNRRPRAKPRKHAVRAISGVYIGGYSRGSPRALSLPPRGVSAYGGGNFIFGLVKYTHDIYTPPRLDARPRFKYYVYFARPQRRDIGCNQSGAQCTRVLFILAWEDISLGIEILAQDIFATSLGLDDDSVNSLKSFLFPSKHLQIFWTTMKREKRTVSYH